MGLFGKKETCCICNQNEGTKQLSSGMICKACMNDCGPFLGALNWKNSSPARVHEAIAVNAKNNERLSIFKVDNSVQKYIELDETNKLLRFPQFLSTIIFSYDEIIEYELLQDGEQITKGSLGGAVVGGALLGGGGAIVGGNIGQKKTRKEISEYKIKITTKNSFCPTIYINFLPAGKVKSDSLTFKLYAGNAQSVLSLLAIVTNCATNSTGSDSISGADEIMKYKNLFDQGIITEEEFNAKKKQILSL